MVFYIFRLCRNSGGWEILPKSSMQLDLGKLSKKFDKVDVNSKVLLTVEVDSVKASIFPSGRVLLYDCGEEKGEIVGGKIFRMISKGQGKRRALFVGRFQPFHMGHFKVIRDIVEEYEEIVIVIGGPGGARTLKEPFTFRERKEMIGSSLKAAGMENFEMHAIEDVKDDDVWNSRIRRLGRFDTAFTRNSWTEGCLRKIGIPVRKQKNYERYKHCGTKIRDRIKHGRDWKDLIPEAAYDYIMSINGQERIRNLSRLWNPS